MRRDLHEENRLSWNAANRAQQSHLADQTRFLAEGGITLVQEELALLGQVQGRRVAHLQCSMGQRTVSLARLGATATGIDISDEAISAAQVLAQQTHLKATFVRADLYDWLAQAAQDGEQFDIVFSSYGSLGWLSDLASWAQGIAAILRHGGHLALLEFHPVSWIFAGNAWQTMYSYFAQGTVNTWDSGVGDYVADKYAVTGKVATPWRYEMGEASFHNPYRAHGFRWSVGDIITALLHAHLHLSVYVEYPFSYEATHPRMRLLNNGRLEPPDDIPSVPLLLGLVAYKIAS